MTRDSFIFYRSFYDGLNVLKPNDRLKLFEAICEYALNGTEPKLTGYPMGMFEMARPQLDTNNKKYEDGKKGKEYGKLGGRPKKNKPCGDKTENPMGFLNDNPTPLETKTPNVNVNDNDIPFNVDSSINTKMCDLISLEFKRELTVDEVKQVGAMCSFYGDKLVEYALRECAIYQKLNFEYLVAILRRWRADGMTPEKYEAGES